ncbi:MAG TPA: glycosyltransferase family 2 protein [Opitutaceae bacterium]|nr:glycosyltransferase family 2 protein [Opitutaceae bacterium]
MPAVSVLIVFHRDTPFLRPAIASVLGQTLSDFELILVDNGTGLQAEDLGQMGRDGRITWVRKERNVGIADGINAGVHAATAEFIALLDYDDVMLPHRLARQIEWLRTHATLGLVGSGATVIDEAARATGREFCLVDAGAQRTFSAYFSGAIASSLTGRAEVFRAFPHRPVFRWASDFDFAARVAESHGMAAVPEVLLRYRRHAAQTTVLHRTEQVMEECYVRLLTARRRRGGDEAFALLAAERQTRPVPSHAREIHREFGRRFLDEGFAPQATYQARRLVITGRDFGSWREALRIVARSVRASPRETWFLLRLFLMGPVRAHGLSNRGPSLPELS